MKTDEPSSGRPKQEFLFETLIPEFQKGKDELNLAEFPIAAVGYRVESAQKTIVYQDETFDKALNKVINRRLTISASDDCSLPTASDDEVLLGLLQITYKQGFKNRTVNFRPLDLIKILGWPINGGSYDRLRESLSRWVGVTLRYNNAWRDKTSGQWKDQEFHIIDAQSFTSNVHRGKASIEGGASFTWNEVVFANFQAGNLKSLDFEFYRRLKSSIAKRMYRFLDKRFWHRDRLTFDLERFAFEKIGLSRSVNIDTAQVKRRLAAAIEELERLNFIRAMPPESRFTKLRRGQWDIHFEKYVERASEEQAAEPQAVSGPLEARLTAHGITVSKSRRLVSEYDPERIEAQLEGLDFLMAQGGGAVPLSRAGWLVKAITENWTPPRGFVPQEERNEAARQAAEKAQKRDELRRRREEARQTKEAAQRAAAAAQEAEVDAYLTGLTEDERLALEREALTSSPLARERIGPALKKSIVSNFIVNLLESR